MSEEKFNVDWRWFREKREAINEDFSQNEMARRLAIDEGTMSKIIGGHQKATIQQAINIALILGVTLPEVMEKLGYDLRGVMTKKEAGGLDERTRGKLIAKGVEGEG